MKKANFNVGIGITNDMSEDGVCQLYFLDTIQNKQEVNWLGIPTGEETSLLGEIINTINETKPTKIIQNIDSWGGSAPVGLGIYNFLKDYKAKKETKILNNCASIATIMSAAGDKGKITMPRNGMMVIHQASCTAQGTSKELREAADVTDKYTENIVDVYVQTNRKGKTYDEIYNLIKDGDYWMTGTQAKEMGFVDDTYNDDSITISNSIKSAKKIYNNIPQHILDMANEEEESNEVPKSTKNFLTNLFNKLTMEVKEIVNTFKTDISANKEIPKEVTDNIANSLEIPITNLVKNITNEVDEKIKNVVETTTANIKNTIESIENKYKEQLEVLTNSLKEIKEKNESQVVIINELKKTNEGLATDITNLQGKQSPSSGTSTNTIEDKNKKPSFSGKVKFTTGSGE